MGWFGKKKETQAEASVAVAAPPGMSKREVWMMKADKKIDMMNKRIEYMSKQSEAARAQALKYKQQNRIPQAKQFLRKSLDFQKQADTQSKIVSNLMAMQSKIRQAEDVQVTRNLMAEGVGHLKNTLDVDKVADTMDDVREQMDRVQEVNDVMAESMGGVDDFDIEDEMAELEAEAAGLSFEQEEAQSSSKAVSDLPALPEAGSKPILPSAGAGRVQQQQSNADKELADLEAQFA